MGDVLSVVAGAKLNPLRISEDYLRESELTRGNPKEFPEFPKSLDSNKLERRICDMEVHEILNSLLRKHRRKAADLAREIKAGPATVSAWLKPKSEGGNEPSAHYLPKIAAYFGISVDELTGRTEGHATVRRSDLTEDERFIIRVIRSLEFDAEEATRVLAMEFAQREAEHGTPPATSRAARSNELPVVETESLAKPEKRRRRKGY